MKPQWDSQVTQLKGAIQTWDESYPALPAEFKYQGNAVSKEVLNEWLRRAVSVMETIAKNNDIDPGVLFIHQPGIFNVIPTISTAIANVRNNPQQYMEQIFGNCWTILVSVVWLLPPPLIKKQSKFFADANFAEKIASVESMSNELANALVKISAATSQISQINDEVKKHLEATEGHEREAGNARTNAEASASTALTSKQAVESLLAEISAGAEKYNELLSKIDELQDKAQAALESTSKVGLAKSFSARKEKLEGAQVLWRFMFIAGIVSLFGGALFAVFNGLLYPIVDAKGKVEAWGLVSRVLLAGPLVWFTWFAARQYGLTTRLIEDYAFKEAAALSFVGYQREMEQDGEMIKLLREAAIKSFGTPPSRMLAVSEPASPIHELFDHALEKGVLDKFVELVKALKPGRK